MPKPKSKTLVDSFMAGLMKDAKSAVDSVTKSDEPIPAFSERDYDHIRIISGSYQDRSRIITGQEQDQDGINKISDKEQENSSSLSDMEQDKISPKEHHLKSPTPAPKNITKGAPSISLSKSQTVIYLWLKERGENGVFNKPEIERALSVPYITIRKAVSKLENSGVLTLKYDTCQKSFEYKIDLKKQLKLSKNIRIISGSEQDHIRIGAEPTISSSFKKETTTLLEIQNQLEHHPELGYWRQKGLTPKQVARWGEQFSITTKSVIQALCYCQFDMVENNREKIDAIKDVFNWFFRIVERTGTYPKPANYKSHHEKEIERERARIEEIKRQAEELKRLREEAISAQLDFEFEQMLQEPNSERYKKCINKIPSFVKRPEKIGSPTFIAAMRKVFIAEE